MGTENIDKKYDIISSTLVTTVVLCSAIQLADGSSSIIFTHVLTSPSVPQVISPPLKIIYEIINHSKSLYRHITSRNKSVLLFS